MSADSARRKVDRRQERRVAGGPLKIWWETPWAGAPFRLIRLQKRDLRCQIFVRRRISIFQGSVPNKSFITQP
jgi:hypothetical protein